MGLKQNDSVGCPAVSKYETIIVWSLAISSSFSTEATAFKIAFSLKQFSNNDKALTISDSLFQNILHKQIIQTHFYKIY